MIGLYCMCANNEFRIDLSDIEVYRHWNIAKNTYVKYRNLLINKRLSGLPMMYLWHSLGLNIWMPKLSYTLT